MSRVCETAMVLAAGMGSRLRPLTDEVPKPLVNIGGSPVILRSLWALKEAGVRRAVINTHYMAQMLEKTVRAQTMGWGLQIYFSFEKELRETGGGIKKALPLLGEKPFVVVNSDAVWNDEEVQLLRPLMAGFDPRTMDVLMAVVNTKQTVDFRTEGGDFKMVGAAGKLTKPEDRAKCNVVYAGIHVTHQSFIEFEAAERFSLTKPWDEAMAQGRLRGWKYGGSWVDMGTHVGLLKAREWVAEAQRRRAD